MLGKILTFTLALGFVATSAMADDTAKDKMAETMTKYEKTGAVKLCVTLTRIDSTKVFDDYNILFKMKGNKAYLNTLPHRCARLGFEKSFSYAVSTNQLCNVDLITVFDSSSNIQGPTCGLGKFVEYKEKDKAEKTTGQ